MAKIKLDLHDIFNQKYVLFALGTMLLFGALIYSNTLHSSFHLDDIPSIIVNPAIRDIGNLQAIWNFWPGRFITYFSVALNYHFGHLNVFGYHIFNLTVHLISGILVWWLMLLTFSTSAMKEENVAAHAKLLAFFAGLIFIAHPIQTQGVTYIIQRAASLTTLFYLASLSLYVKSRLLHQQRGVPAASKLFYHGSLIAAVTAMFTKEMAITLPFAILLYETCFLERERRLNWKYLIPFFAALLIIPLTMFLTKYVDFAGMRRAAEASYNISPGQYLLTQFRVMVTYLRLLFLPINQNLDYYYPISKSLFELPVLASLAFLISILTAAIRVFSKYRLLSFSIFWFFLTLLPESSVVPIKDVIYEHRLYLPMVGFSFFLTGLIYYLFENRAIKAMVIALLIITSCYAALAYKRNFVWKDELTLWNDVVHRSPEKARPYNNRGNAYWERENLAQALPDFNKAIEINPSYTEAYINRGNIYSQQGNLPQAVADYTKAIEMEPNFARAYSNRGNAYYQQGNFTQAIADLSRAIEINPRLEKAYYNRGFAYYAIKEYDKAWIDVHTAEALGAVIDPSFLNGLKGASGRDA